MSVSVIPANLVSNISELVLNLRHFMPKHPNMTEDTVPHSCGCWSVG